MEVTQCSIWFEGFASGVLFSMIVWGSVYFVYYLQAAFRARRGIK